MKYVSTGKSTNWDRLRCQIVPQLVGLFQLEVATFTLQYEVCYQNTCPNCKLFQ